MIDIMTLVKPIGELYTSGKYREALEELERAWITLPVPKESVLNSYTLVSYGAIIGTKSGDLDTAKKWAERGLAYSGNFNLGGESEFQYGEVAFARGELESAATYFKKARKNSGKRLFKGKNPRYFELTEA